MLYFFLPCANRSKLLKKTEISLPLALVPIILLVLLLSFNVSVFGDDALGGSNQFILLMGAAIAAIVGFVKKISYESMLQRVTENLKSVTGAILILLFVGALAGAWLISGIIPAMIYYPVPLHMQKAYSGNYEEGAFPITEDLCKKVFSLPMHTELEEDQIKLITSSVLEFLNKTV